LSRPAFSSAISRSWLQLNSDCVREKRSSNSSMELMPVASVSTHPRGGHRLESLR
jgi:hypothetical protein